MVVILAIDLGTTSAKVVCIDWDSEMDSFEILQRTSLAYHEHLKSSQFNDLNKDNLNNLIKIGSINPFLILSTLVFCIEQLDIKFREQIKAIGCCGQMHGVLYYSKQSLEKIRSINSNELNFDLKFNKNYQDFTSDLITWEDGRCDKKFLDQLPDNSNFENRKAFTGYGIATTFWLIKNDPNYLINKHYMGSIMDFLVHILCVDLEHPVTSIQLANSYGYFDMKKNDWYSHLNDSKHKFPNHLLPTVLKNNEKAGFLKYNFLKINENVPVFVACGDLQCAIYSAMFSKDEGTTVVLNSGTSLQLAFPIGLGMKMNDSMRMLKFLNSKIQLPLDFSEPLDKIRIDISDIHLDIVPYFNDNYRNYNYLATCSSLNGGRVVSFFVKSIENMLNDLFDEIEVKLDESKLWPKLTKLAKNYIEKKSKSSIETDEDELNIEPRLFGERFEEIKSKFSINSISFQTNFELGRLYYVLCSSIIDNIFKMCPIHLLKEIGIQTICSSGSTIMKNEILKFCLEQKLMKEQMNLIHASDVESDLGMALVTAQNYLNLRFEF